ncbi:MAG: hypothetical protein M0P58_05740 [Bacteroidales bacterium]|nr:hypothetical protein [Bacteroidales bacterium]
MKRISSLFLVLIFCFQGFTYAQKPSDQVKSNDTTNQTDKSGNKFGYWEETIGDIIYSGIYRDNQKSGAWTGQYPNKMISGIEHYSNGMKDGIVIRVDRHGKINQIENYKTGMLHGQSLSFGAYSDNPSTEINYFAGKKNGTFKQYYDNGKIQEESYFINDKKNGVSKWSNKTGHIVAEYNYKNGDFDGSQKTYYDNDTLQSVNNYVNNQLSGVSKEYYRNGMEKITGQYIAGIKEGAWTEFDESGKVLKVTKYKGGIAK